MEITSPLEEKGRKALDAWLSRPAWWHEVALILFFYGLYSLIRNVHGSTLSKTTAFAHANDIIDFQRSLGVLVEADIQEYFLDNERLITGLNAYYGSAHFLVTIGVLLWLFHFQRTRYRKWRSILFATTFFALIGYMVYPLAPPRFFPELGFVDTMKTIGGLWDFEDGPAAKVSNQYAAMPSLHSAWAAWCAIAIIPVLKSWWTKALMVLYPLLTVFTIVVTGNHYFADVAGGLLVLGLGGLLVVALERRWKRWATPLSTITNRSPIDDVDRSS